MSKPKTIGVIGLGSIGMRHAKNLCTLVNKVVAYDPEEKRAYELMRHRPANFPPGTVTKIEELFEVSDAIVIASPTPTHADMMFMALEAKKPFFVEKPISDRVRCGYATMVGYNLRFHSCVKKAKEWLDAGLIGEPLWANFTVGQYNDKPAYLRDGVILNWSHEIDLALYLLGGGSVAGSSTRLSDGHDDMTDILLTHVNGCRTTVHLDYLTKPEQRTFIIQGTKAKIAFDLVGRSGHILYEHRLYRPGDDDFFGDDSWDENYVEEMQAFIDRIDGKETLGATGAEGLAVLDICLEVRKQAGLDPDAYKHIALGICRKCRKLHYSNEVCS